MASTTCLAAFCASAADSADELAKKLDPFMAEMEASPLAPPSYSLAVASGDTLLYSRVKGKKILGGDDPLTLDTPLYIASVTKSFMGLLAAKLDADGIVPLDATLADMWPSLDLPAPIDATGITMRDLLTHTAGIENDPLVIGTAYVGDIGVNAYEEILEQHSKPIERSLTYDNIGYLIYAAILENRTGRTWQKWLADEIHEPLGLASAITQPGSVADGTLGVGSHFSPVSKKGWIPAAAKPDDLMHPAGGHFISTADAIRWLQANMNQSVLASAVYAEAQRPYAYRKRARKYGDMTCDGYALGWNICDYSGHRVLYHGGTYNGMMIFMTFMPDDDLVISSINGARAYGWTFGLHGMQQAIDYALKLEDADANAGRRLEGRLNSQQRYLRSRVRKREKVLRAATAPEAVELRQQLIGQYRSGAFGPGNICEKDGKLILSVGSYTAEIVAGRRGEAYVMDRAYGEPQKIAVVAGPGAGPFAFNWEGGRFEKLSSREGCVGNQVEAR